MTFNLLFNVGMLMTKRVTIMIDDDLDKKIRVMQAKLIQKENKSVSYSHVMNLILQKELK